jgi:serine protease
MKKLIAVILTTLITITAVAQGKTEFDVRDLVMTRTADSYIFQVIVKFNNPYYHRVLLQVPEFEKPKSEKEEFVENILRRAYNMEKAIDIEIGQRFLAKLSKELDVEVKHLRTMSLDNDLIQITSTKPIEMVMEELKNLEDIKKAQLNRAFKVKKFETTNVNGATWDGTYYNDTFYSSQSYFGSFAENKANSNFEIFKQNLENNLGRSLRIGIVDSGSSNHEDVRVDGGYSFLSSTAINGEIVYLDRNEDHVDGTVNPDTGVLSVSGHGTAVASTIAAYTDNGLGLTGALNSENLEMIHAKVCGLTGCNYNDTVDAIIWLSGGEVPGIPNIETPVDIINLSLGGGSPAGCGDFYQEAINFAVEQGVIVVIAAGNENTNAEKKSPAACKNAITVAAVDHTKQDRSSFSNYGNATVDFAVAGSNIIVAEPNYDDPTELSSEYSSANGTSFASPLAAAIVGGLKMKYPDLTHIQIERILEANSNEIDFTISGNVSECKTLGCGAGTVDAYASLMSIENLLAVNQSKVKHVYEDSTDTRYLEEMNNLIPICELYKSQFGSIGAQIEGIEYNLYTYSGDGEITENNATLFSTISDPIFVINSPDRIAYQSCQGGNCSELFEMSKTSTNVPNICL